MLFELLVAPFADYGFMRRALVGGLALALSGSPLGVFLVLRRMSLAGDALSHAILPGAAVGYLVAGLSLPAMTLGGLAAGLVVALLSGAVARISALREDASLAAFYLVSLALGVTLVSIKGSSIDLLHVLFGSALALDDAALYLLAGVASVTLALLAIFYRALVLDTLDPDLPAPREPLGRVHPLPFPEPRRAQSRRGLSGAGHADGGRADDASRRGRKASGPRFGDDAAARRAHRRGSRPMPASSSPITPARPRAPPSCFAPASPISSRSPSGQGARVRRGGDDATTGVALPGAACARRSACRGRDPSAPPCRRELLDTRAISCARSGATRSASACSSVLTATRMSMSRRPPTRERSARPSSSSSMGSASRAGSTGSSPPPNAKSRVVVASAGITPRKLDGGLDPHAWQDVANARRYVENIRDALKSADPERAAALRGESRGLSRDACCARQGGRACHRGDPEPTAAHRLDA